MRFWDASAIIPLLLDEATSTEVTADHARDADIVVWWGTVVECHSAMARRERDGAMVDRARERLDLLATTWREVRPSVELRAQATRICRVHPLRAADAFQLAAALTAADGEPASLEFLTYDTRLADAARREGFRVSSPGV